MTTITLLVVSAAFASVVIHAWLMRRYERRAAIKARINHTLAVTARQQQRRAWHDSINSRL